MKSWSIWSGKDGYSIAVMEKRFTGVALTWLLDHDPGWWGKYKNVPFCVINPWAWTWHVGPEDHTLGDLWCNVGNWLYHLAWKLEKEQILYRSDYLTEDQLKKFPRFWDEE